MHSRIIALNVITNEDEVFEYMNGVADYVVDRGQDDDWGLEILERIGTVDREAHTFSLDRQKVIETLWAAYNYYQEREIDTFDAFADSMRVYRAASALEDRYAIYIYDDWNGYPVPWLEFLRQRYKYPKGDQTYTITSIYDYHC